MGIPSAKQPKVLIKPSVNGYDSTDPNGAGGNIWIEGEPAITLFSSGGEVQDSTGTISGSNFSSLRQQPLYFTDFEGGVVGETVVGSPEWLDGDISSEPKDYHFSDVSPLTGTRVARVNPVEERMGYLKALTDSDELFFEYYFKMVKHKFSSTPDSPQIKESRMSNRDAHGTRPYIGITHQGGEKGDPTVVYSNGVDDIVYYPSGVIFPEDEWVRETIYFKIGDLETPNGYAVMRTSYNDQWSHSSAGDLNLTPDDWDEPPKVTRRGEGEAKFTAMWFPFFHRWQQITSVEINHIVGNDTRERVILSTAPVWSASTEYKHVSCPTLSRRADQVTYKSMIGCLPENSNVYAYVVNADGGHNTNGILVRSVQ